MLAGARGEQRAAVALAQRGYGAGRAGRDQHRAMLEQMRRIGRQRGREEGAPGGAERRGDGAEGRGRGLERLDHRRVEPRRHPPDFAIGERQRTADQRDPAMPERLARRER